MYAAKNVLITGASSRLGKNLAINYVREGAQIINLSRSLLRMQELNSQLNKINQHENTYHSIDTADYQALKKVSSKLTSENINPDIVISNAAGNFLCQRLATHHRYSIKRYF